MNKLLTKIVGLSLGLSMAIGVGVAASYSEKDAVKADAADSLAYTLQPASGTNNSYAGNCDIEISGITWNLTGNSQQQPWRIGGNSISGVDRTLYSKTAITDDITKIDVTHGTANSITVNSVTLIVSTNADFSSPVSTLTPTFVASNTMTINRPSGVSWANCYYKFIYNVTVTATKNKYLEFSKAEFYKEASGGVSKIDVTAGSMVGTYQGDAYIQCTAKADDVLTNDVTWTISSDTTYVADQTSVTGASIDSTGKVSFTGAVNVYAFATSTITTTVRNYALCSGTSLLAPVDYVKVDKSSRLSAGTKVVILNSALTYAMSVTQNSNNRAATEITVDDSGTDPVAKVIPTKVQVFTLVTGVESGFNFSFDDGGTTKYLYANGTGSNNYLKAGTSRYANSTDFNISVVNGETSISLVQTSYNGVMQYNSSKLFSCYASATQSAVSIFMEGSSLPDDQNLSSISNISASNVEVGSTIHVTASYSPTDATENIVVTTSGAGSVTCSEVSMSAGTATFTVTGDSAGSVTITLTGETTTTATANTTISVTSFTATHTKVTSTSSLYNGAKVIFGNSNSGLVGAAHTGGNNMPTAVGSFSEDGSSLSNASGNGREYTMWYLTIKDSEETDVSGWAFYDHGYYLTCVTTNDNHWKRTDTLTSLCLFTLSFSGTDTSIVCADTHVNRNTILYNDSNSIFSAYASSSSYDTVDMYLKESSSDTAIAAGYEDFFLMMDVNLSSHGYCTSKHWYDFAKDAYNNTLTTTQKGYLSSDAIARLSAWAAANGDTLSGGSLSAKTTTGLLMLGDETTAITIIVIIAAISITSIGVLLVLKKRKQQF